jgi:excisionase family DNA binding protein
MTPSEVCELLRISDRTLWRYQSDGRIEAILLPSRHRRFRRADVEALIAPLST